MSLPDQGSTPNGRTLVQKHPRTYHIYAWARQTSELKEYMKQHMLAATGAGFRFRDEDRWREHRTTGSSSSGRQCCVARSTWESEYMAPSHAVNYLVWARQIALLEIR
jgi:hypothetical protein